METAKIFKNGRSQAVRIPKKFRLPGNEVAITREGDRLILSPIPERMTLEKFFALPGCPDFDPERENVGEIQEREFFQ